MISLTVRLYSALGAACLLACGVSAQEMICYDTPNGKVCGDSVPPEHAEFDRVIIDNRGIVVRTEDAAISPEEQAAIEERQRRDEEQRALAEERQRYGQMLLDSFTSVESIEALRDRMLEQIAGQTAVLEVNLSNLNNKLVDLERRAERYAPYSDREDAAPMPQNLATDIDRTKSSIAQFQRRLEESQQNYADTETRFENDIAYFKQLKDLGV